MSEEALQINPNRVFESFKQQVVSQLELDNTRKFFQDYYKFHLSQLELVINGEKDNEGYIFIVDDLDADGKFLGPVTNEILAIIKEEFKLEQINHIPSEASGFTEVTAYKTNLDRIFVFNSVLKKELGTSSAWTFVRVDPGKEQQYTWLPEDYKFAAS